ncbi:hypothetical protein GCM10010872_03160 [Dyella flava]|nr:hypothetical protein GCM10010872_03160 [Dyella flava]
MSNCRKSDWVMVEPLGVLVTVLPVRLRPDVEVLLVLLPMTADMEGLRISYLDQSS